MASLIHRYFTVEIPASVVTHGKMQSRLDNLVDKLLNPLINSSVGGGGGGVTGVDLGMPSMIFGRTSKIMQLN